MNYTESPESIVHPGTGHRMHDDSQPVPTMVTDADLNSVIWSLMEVVVAAGLTPISFNPDDPASYRVLRASLESLFTKAASSAETRAGLSTSKAVTPKSLADSVLGGFGQSRQNLMGSRSLSSTYYNTTDRPILVVVALTIIANPTQINMTVDGDTDNVFGASSGSDFTYPAIIPPGSGYSFSILSGAANLKSWIEHR